MSEHTRIHDKFEYHLEDLNCSYCLYGDKKTNFYRNCKKNKTCYFIDIRLEAIKNKRIKRPPGWFKLWLPNLNYDE